MISFDTNPIATAPRSGEHVILGYYKDAARGRSVSNAVVFVEASWAPRQVWNNDANRYEKHRDGDTDGSWVDYANRLVTKVTQHSREGGNFPRYWSDVPTEFNPLHTIPLTGEFVLVHYRRGFVEDSSWETGCIQARWKPRKMWDTKLKTWVTTDQGVPMGEWVDYSNRPVAKSWAKRSEKNEVLGWLPLPEVIENI